MAKIQVGRFVRLLLILMAVVLALPTAADGAFGTDAAAAPARHSASGAGSASTAPVASDPSEDGEAALGRCLPRRGGRAAATVCVPAPPGTAVSTDAPVRTEGGLRLAAPLTGRQAVPVSRSGELPVHHLVFRC
ncbi:hypothetical protein ACGFOU_31255 [Streptomyces sp. NPDC048595]|uniref:hypothetical protein n=1 Tax=Streptomyces sp. NPDC048595 TaxID=3365576 RepID=UPI003713F4AB